MKKLNGPTYAVPSYPLRPTILRKSKTLWGAKQTLTIASAIREGMYHVYFETV